MSRVFLVGGRELGFGSWDLGVEERRKFGWLAGSNFFGSWELGFGSWELTFFKPGVEKYISTGESGGTPYRCFTGNSCLKRSISNFTQDLVK